MRLVRRVLAFAAAGAALIVAAYGAAILASWPSYRPAISCEVWLSLDLWYTLIRFSWPIALAGMSSLVMGLVSGGARQLWRLWLAVGLGLLFLLASVASSLSAFRAAQELCFRRDICIRFFLGHAHWCERALPADIAACGVLLPLASLLAEPLVDQDGRLSVLSWLRALFLAFSVVGVVDYALSGEISLVALIARGPLLAVTWLVWAVVMARRAAKEEEAA